jgi:predicted oxidoreductase
VRAGVASGKVTFKFRHRVDEIVRTNGTVTGVRGTILEPSTAQRGKATSRTVVGDFELNAPVVIVTSGGIGANHDLVRQNWPARLGTAPKTMITGVPAYVDGRMLGITASAGGRIVNPDRMWHYTEGLRNYDPIWPNHGIRILPGPSSMWFDATGKRFSAPDMPGYDTLHTLGSITASGYDYSWFVTTSKIIAKEFALSGSEQNPDLTNKDILMLPLAHLADAGADREVQEERRRLHHRHHPLRTGPRHEQAHRRRTDQTTPTCSGRSRPATGRSTTRTRRTPR